ncbi:hypothetical protein L873DRAFT_1791359 [Choiromyces venosus 120613-1]|uniref:Uncharacterized protein n=1 Tax=Choiromyces venosus 120613-1 TaxID=1336337 RepID=A0A3N4JF88_9PEZI|nr:hypothetical protein L873DRAFT_1791359 [Choiromyces venosus 120613-1]
MFDRSGLSPIDWSGCASGANLSRDSQAVVGVSAMMVDSAPGQPQVEILIFQQEQTNNRLDSMESRLTSFERTLQQIKGQIVVGRDVRQGILQASEVKKTISSIKEFVDAPNSIMREVDIFKTLKLISKRLGDLERSLTQTTLKVKIRSFIKSIFQRIDLKSADYFDRRCLLAFLSKNGTAGLEASLFIKKKLDMQKILSEFYNSASQSRKEKLQLVAAKWRLITETIWSLPLPPRKWWQQVFSLLETLHKDNIHGSDLSLHEHILSEDREKYLLSERVSVDDLGDINDIVDVDNSEPDLDFGVESHSIDGSGTESEQEVDEESFGPDFMDGNEEALF